MEISLIQTIKGSSKYDILYESVCQMMNGNTDFEVSKNNYDAKCLICIGNLTTEIIAKRQTNKCTVIRFLFRSDVSNHFYTDETLIDYTFWVNDLDINILYPYLQISNKIEVPFDFLIKESDMQEMENAKFDIYVNTGEFLYMDSALFKILRTLNRLTRCSINVCSRNKNIINMMNANICILDSSSSIEEHIKNSKMVIGSGYSIFYAIKHRKPFIIVGERGYGGIPTQDNIKQYYQEFFQGAIGGRLDGPLPENLVYEDILNIQNGKYEHYKEFGKVLSHYTEDIARKVNKITKYIVKTSQDIDHTNLQFNTDYTIIEGNGYYWLLNRFTRLIIRKLDISEIDYLKYHINFIQNKENKPQLSESKIQELISNKVLIQKALSNLANK